MPLSAVVRTKTKRKTRTKKPMGEVTYVIALGAPMQIPPLAFVSFLSVSRIAPDSITMPKAKKKRTCTACQCGGMYSTENQLVAFISVMRLG